MRFFDGVQVVAPAPTPLGTESFQPTAASASFRTFAAAGASEGDTFPYVAWDGTDREVGIGIYHEGPPISIERSVVLSSTNGDSKVPFGPGGTLNIGCALPGIFAESLLGAASPQSIGALFRFADWSMRTRVFDSNSELVGWSNPDGLADAPALEDLGLALWREAGASLAQRTMLGQLVLDFASMIATQNDFGILGPGGATDERIFFDRNGVRDYTPYFGIGGARTEALTARDFVVPERRTSTSNTEATVEGALTIPTLTVPSHGTWRLWCLSRIHGTVSGAGDSGTIESTIRVDTTAVDSSEFELSVSTGVAAAKSALICDYGPVVIANGAHSIDVQLTLSGNASLNAGGDRKHSLSAWVERVG